MFLIVAKRRAVTTEEFLTIYGAGGRKLSRVGAQMVAQMVAVNGRAGRYHAALEAVKKEPWPQVNADNTDQNR